MVLETLHLNFLSLFLLISFFINLFVQKITKKKNYPILLDTDFQKPQAFHKEAIPRCGGVAAMISLIIFFIIYYYIFKVILLDYILLGIGLFTLGFLDDIKFEMNPNIRLILMIIFLSFGINFLSINIESVDLIFLEKWLINNIFNVVFILLCFLFIINGANLIDGFNGLLGIHLLIINFILLILNFESGLTELILPIIALIIVLMIFLIFNFPKAKIFCGDGGAYLFGTLTAINIIKTNNLNPEITSFFFCGLLFYLFFEVFFSFFRKLCMKKSPLKPDNRHLHMLIYKYLENAKFFKENNFITSLIINSFYLALLIPTIIFKNHGFISRYWFFLTLIIYMIFYWKFNNMTKIKK